MNARFSKFSCLVASMLVMFSSVSWAQAFPDHPIRVIVPYAPGGGTDIILRLLAPKAGQLLGQSIVIENKPGGSTMLGTNQVIRSAPDGYTLVAADSTILINPAVNKNKLPYDTLKDLQGVSMLATSPVVLLLNPQVPAKNLTELIALAKAKPGQLNYGSGGIGAGTHLAGELLNIRANIEMMHVPYNGTSPGLNAVISGDVQMMFGGISSGRPFIESGRVRGIALTGRERNAAVPDIPTFAEYGLEMVDASTYWGIYAPVGVPKPIVEKISQAFAQAMKDPAALKSMTDLGYQPIGNTPAQHTDQLRAMVGQWIDVVQKANIKID